MSVRERPSRGDALSSVGRARRHACQVQSGRAELWSFDPGDAGVARRLATLGARGVGGFDLGWGEDEDGAFAIRRIPSRTADELARGERLEGSLVRAKFGDLAGALDACERAGIFPGPLRPAEIALGGEGRTDAWIVADGWVRALVRGADDEPHATISAPSPRWTPPEQADGAPWDNAANRYVLGLVVYRLAAGVHPFAGGGLREAMRAQAAPVAPFEEAVARALPPGLQSLVLTMLDPDPSRRPARAADVVARLHSLGASAETNAKATPVAARPAVATSARPLAVPAPSPRRWASAAKLAPLAAGVVVAVVVGLLAEPAPSTSSASAAPRRSLLSKPLAADTAEACASCHAREVFEWQRSVMAHAAKSPLFGALESVVEEQVGRDDRCPDGAGVLRRAGGAVCRDARTGLALTGTGGEHWCVNCHAAADNLGSRVPSWDTNDVASRRPLRDTLPAQAMEGISCAVCHTTTGPAHAGGTGRAAPEGASAGRDYTGNPSWVSPFTGAIFATRPEDGSGVFGIGNSGYLLDRSSLLSRALGAGGDGDPIVHRRASTETRRYLGSSEFCGACHDVRLFGTDAVGVRERGEHFKRLRNAYSEWRSWADGEKAAGRRPATCQDCHMSLYPGICVPGTGGEGSASGCPPGFKFEARAPGEQARGRVASSSAANVPIASHYFTSVDLPLSAEFPDAWGSDRTLDANGQPVGLAARRQQLLRHTFRFELEASARVVTDRLEIPVLIQNTGAGHRVPAGFSQEREIWVELTVTDARGDVVYEVGKIDSDVADLRDKVFLRTTTTEGSKDRQGRPLGMFGADVLDGPDAPRWQPNPVLGGTTFRGSGLVNLQNGFLRCVKCIGVVDAQGRCQATAGQGRTRADRFDDGAYDLDTGECRSNLAGAEAFFETYFPVGALDAERGVVKAPDAIIDTRSAPPNVPLRYVYEIDARGRPAPFRVSARLRFRPYPPFLLRAFADYEARQNAEGRRPSGPQLGTDVLRRLEVVDLAEASRTLR